MQTNHLLFFFSREHKTIGAASRRDAKAVAPYIFWRVQLYFQLDNHFFRGWMRRVWDLWEEVGVAETSKRRVP